MTETKIRYITTCRTCGTLPGATRFSEDAIGKGRRHQEANTSRVLVFEPANPAHACTVERRVGA